MMVRLSPMIEVARLFNEVDRLLDEVTGTMMNRNGLTSVTTIRPAVDLYDNGDALVLRALVPGAQPGSLDVQIEQNTVRIKGRFGAEVDEDEAKGWTWYRREIGSGEFSHSMTLPVPVDAERAEAAYNDGILTLTMPKAEHARARKIEVRTPKALASSLN